MKVFSDHCGPKGDKGDTGPPGAAGTPGLSAIGTPITSAIANAILFADASGNLAQDAALTYANDGQGVVLGDRTFATLATQLYPSGFFSSGNDPQDFVDLSSGAGSSPYLNIGAGATHDPFLKLSSAGGFYELIVEHGSGLLGFDCGGNYALSMAQDLSVTMHSLAGTGTRAVFVDANGKLSAP